VRAARRAGVRLTVTFATVALLAGCGAKAPDLLIVTRTGMVPGARLTLLVSDGGFVHCNGGPALTLSDPLLLEARYITSHLHDNAQKGLALPPGPQSVLHYALRDEDGHVSFSDDSPGQPPETYRLALLVREIAREVCHLPR
jgi:hypothetical protein